MALLSTRVSSEKLRSRLDSLLPERFPGVAFEISSDPGMLEVAWTHGPTSVSVATATGAPAGWDVRTRLAWQAAEPPGERSSLLLLRRRFRERALALGAVRYQGAYNRPYASSEPRAQPRLLEILDVDDPERSGYPIVDAMAEMLLELPRDSDANTADALAAALYAGGYERLWSAAYGTVWL